MWVPSQGYSDEVEVRVSAAAQAEGGEEEQDTFRVENTAVTQPPDPAGLMWGHQDGLKAVDLLYPTACFAHITTLSGRPLVCESGNVLTGESKQKGIHMNVPRNSQWFLAPVLDQVLKEGRCSGFERCA